MSDLNVKGLNFNINDEPELSDYMELSFQSLMGEKVKSANSLLYKIALNISNNDISKAELNIHKRPIENKNEIIFLNKMFIDNVVLSSISTKGRKKDDIGYYNIIIRNHFKQIYNNRRMRVMCISTSTNNDLLTKQNIKRFTELTNAKLKNDNDSFKLMDYLIKLNDIDKDRANNILQGQELQALNNQGIYINNIDYTVDLGFSFDSDILINELMTNFNFHFDGELHLRFIEEKYKNIVHFWILDKLTDIKIRVKIYNKFIQTMESPAVRTSTGSHLLHWINHDNKDFDDAIFKSLDYGYSRLEMTFYNDTIPSDDLVHRNFEFVYDIIKKTSNDAIFYNTINNQFKAIMDQVSENLFVFDKTKKQLLQVRWYNKLSNKMNGIIHKKIGYFSNRLINILGRFTFNDKPIKIVMIEYDKANEMTDTDENENNDSNELYILDDENDENDEKKIPYDKNQRIKINVRTYLKTGYNYTNLSDTNERMTISHLENQPIVKGIDYQNMNFIIQTEINNNQLKNELNNIFFTMIITDKKIEYLQTNKIKMRATITTRKHKVLNIQGINDQVERFKINNEIKNEEFKKYQMKRLININKLNEIDNYYTMTISEKKSFKDYNINEIFFITAFMFRGNNIVLFYDYIKTEWIFGNAQLLDFINNEIVIKYYQSIKHKDFDNRKIYYFTNANDDIDYIATAILTKKTVNKHKDKLYILSITNNLSKETYINEDDKNDNNDEINGHDEDVIYEINDEIKRINTLTFDNLELTETYEIVGIKRVIYRKMYHYYFHIKYQKKYLSYNNCEKKIYVANGWMRDVFESLDINLLIGEKPLYFKILPTKKSSKSKLQENLIEMNDKIISQYKL